MRDSPLAADACKMFCANSIWYCFVTIPKVASTYLKKALPGDNFNIWDWKWSAVIHEVPARKDVRYVVMMRDPVDRWITGVIEYWYKILPVDQWTIDHFNDMIEQIEFDNHTRPQSDFLPVIDHERTTWLWMTPQVENNPWFFDHQIKLSPVPRMEKNIGSDRFNNRGDDSVKSWIKQLLADQNNLGKIQSFYRADYDLMKSVEFYNHVDFLLTHDTNKD